MTIIIDTNILLDILLNDLAFYARSKTLIEKYINQEALVISPIVYAELLTQFIRKFGALGQEKLNDFLKDVSVFIEEFTHNDFVLAGIAWEKYTKANALNKVQCPACGEENSYSCKQCKRHVLWRNHVLTDFVIGAHAQNNGEILLTRDNGFYKKYFKINIVY